VMLDLAAQLNRPIGRWLRSLHRVMSGEKAQSQFATRRDTACLYDP
jgi:hypothetical protein